ncbi:hypothetical protein PITCH_A1580043 [uncultured Desulfobacterium sp.]|uniref:Uncharacterized protein n=1 Tax=uncultured Desulfobacterium sp. TaxID=201089 RepID=A0A445MTV1_9BACT|nr:hypothetical protein PITCH_A1580043 [uncultured Desulfobacterium sp.]
MIPFKDNRECCWPLVRFIKRGKFLSDRAQDFRKIDVNPTCTERDQLRKSLWEVIYEH